jgi:hypothetical protein
VSVDDDEFSYWQLANNIIRYKFGLFGNPDEKSFLGYENIKAGLQTGAINDKMERVLKSYQSLVHQGAVFSHRTPAPPKFNIPAIGSNFATETEPSLKPSGVLPWAQNIGQERFLLSLIMQDYFDLSFDDKKLGTFNTSKSLAPICKQFRKLTDIFPASTSKAKLRDVIKRGVGVRAKNGIGLDSDKAAIPGLDDLPNQVKVLIFNNQGPVPAQLQNKLNINVLYADNNEFNTLYKTQTMFASKFGEFWFKHQNLFEVEYLSSFGSSVTSPPPITLPGQSKLSGKKAPLRYEDLNRSSVKAPVWK